MDILSVRHYEFTEGAIRAAAKAYAELTGEAVVDRHHVKRGRVVFTVSDCYIFADVPKSQALSMAAALWELRGHIVPNAFAREYARETSRPAAAPVAT